MKLLLKPSWFACKWCAQCTGHFILWTIWLVLAVILAFQVFVATTREIAIPAPLRRQLEQQLAATGLKAHFGNTAFDPTGRLSIQDLQLKSSTVDEPVVSVRSLYIVLKPQTLYAGRLVIKQLRVNGATLHVPAMLSPSGHNEAMISDIDFVCTPGDDQLDLETLTARIGNLNLSAHGVINLPKLENEGTRNLKAVIEQANAGYFNFCRQLARITPELPALDQPRLDLAITSSTTGLPLLDINFFAHGATVDIRRWKPDLADGTFTLGPFKAKTRLPLSKNMSFAMPIAGQCDRLTGPSDLDVRDVQWKFNCTLKNTGALEFQPGSLQVRASTLSTPSVTLEHPMIQAEGFSTSPLRVAVQTGLWDEPWSIQGKINLAERGGEISASGRVPPGLLKFVGQKIHRDLEELLQLAQPPWVSLRVLLSDNWKLTQATAQLNSGPVNARNVALDAASADLFFSGTTLQATDITLRLGDSLARGSYTMDTASRDYRFLLDGKLRPSGIAGWFKEWWPHFWNNFEFRSTPPVASVDIQGRWGQPHLTTVFVNAICPDVTVRSVPFDHVNTTLFIRPDFYDALGLHVSRAGREARGRFTRTVDLDENAFRSMDFTVTTNLDIHENARLFGKSGTELVEPFQFAESPELDITGHLDGPAAPGGEHQTAHIILKSKGPMRFHEFPVEDLAFDADLHDDDLNLNKIEAGFAGGRAAIHARLTGKDKNRRMGFDCMLEQASLGQAIGIIEEFSAKRKGEAPPAASKFQQRVTNGRLGLRLSADGTLEDFFSYHGEGSAEITTGELAEINMLGELSKSLRNNSLFGFTSLRLDTLRTNFKLEGNQLIFPELRINGRTAMISAKGVYSLEARQMDFNAKVYPFEQGKTLFAKGIDFFLTPISAALELKLTGSMDAPKWRFLYGPTSLLRSLSGSADKPAGMASETTSTNTPVSQPPPLLRR